MNIDKSQLAAFPPTAPRPTHCLMCAGPVDVVGLFLPTGKMNKTLRPVNDKQAWVVYGLCDLCTVTFSPRDIEYKLVRELGLHVEKWGAAAVSRSESRSEIGGGQS